MTVLNVSVYRYNPENNQKPYMQNYEIDSSACKGVMVLDLLEAIKAYKDSSVTFRRSCGEGVCGSDGMNINGTNGLACVTPFKSLGNKIVLRPLPGLPVVRDLIVDMTQFYKQYETVKPYVQNDTHTTGERIQSQEERAKLDGLYECIMCACCTSACPSYWWNPDQFLGPAALLTANRFVEDSRDEKTDERLEALEDPFSLYRCRTIMNCATVCPKGLNPAKAITNLRQKMVKKAV